MTNDELTSTFGSPIFTYSRDQAVADGVLIDVSTVTREAGFTISVAVTDNEDTQKQTHQDSAGRLWDVLSMLHFAIAKASKTDRIFYKLYVVPCDGKTTKAELMQLKAIIGAGDNSEPVITIMFAKRRLAKYQAR